MATQLKLCKNQDCSATQDEDKYTEKCLLCDGYFSYNNGDNDVWNMDDNDEKELCSLCGAGYYGLVKLKGTGEVVCGGADGCDEDEEDEDEEDEDELWNANLMKGDNNSRLMKEAMKLYPNNREACISHISVRSGGTFNGLVSN